jgi:hypothetical protein
MTYSAATSRPRRAAHWRSSASWLPVSCSSVDTRAQMAHREGINKPYERGSTFPGRTRRSANRLV